MLVVHVKSEEIRKRHVIDEKTGEEYFIFRIGDVAVKVSPELERDPLMNVEGYIRGEIALRGLSARVDEFNKKEDTDENKR